MHDRAVFDAALAANRGALLDAVRDWRALGGRDEDLVLHVDGMKTTPPAVAPQTRAYLERTMGDFEPTVGIELSKHREGHAPAIIALPGLVHAVYWIDLATGDASPAF